MAHKPQFAAQCEQQLGTFPVLCEREGGVGGVGRWRVGGEGGGRRGKEMGLSSDPSLLSGRQGGGASQAAHGSRRKQTLLRLQFLGDTLMAVQAGLGRLAGKKYQRKITIQSRLPAKSDVPLCCWGR